MNKFYSQAENLIEDRVWEGCSDEVWGGEIEQVFLKDCKFSLCPSTGKQSLLVMLDWVCQLCKPGGLAGACRLLAVPVLGLQCLSVSPKHIRLCLGTRAAVPCNLTQTVSVSDLSGQVR